MKVFSTIFPPGTHEEEGTHLTDESLVQLKDLAIHYRKTEKYDEAIQIYQTLIEYMDGAYKILPMIEQARCFLETRQIKIAKQIVNEIVTLLDVIECTDEIKSLREVIETGLRDLADEFIEEVHDIDSALALGRARFTLIKSSYLGITRLLKLERLGLLMQSIAEEMSIQSSRAKYKPQYKSMILFMEEVLEEMQDVDGVGIEVKCTRIAWFLKYAGFVCDEVGDFQKSMMIYQQAITIIRTVFGVNAKYYRVLGHCYNNMAFVLESTGHVMDAVTALRRAIEVFDRAVDWSSEEEKAKCLSKSSAALHEIKAKLTSD